MQVQDYRRLSIITKKITEQRNSLCQESFHEQTVTWKGNSYTVGWRLSFDLISNRFNIEVSCLCSKSEVGLFTWPKSVQREVDAAELKDTIAGKLMSLELTDEWPATLPPEWLENNETQTR